jgi:hypothetical protein
LIAHSARLSKTRPHTNYLELFAAICASYAANTAICVSNPD